MNCECKVDIPWDIPLDVWDYLFPFLDLATFITLAQLSKTLYTLGKLYRKRFRRVDEALYFLEFFYTSSSHNPDHNLQIALMNNIWIIDWFYRIPEYHLDLEYNFACLVRCNAVRCIKYLYAHFHYIPNQYQLKLAIKLSHFKILQWYFKTTRAIPSPEFLTALIRHFKSIELGTETENETENVKVGNAKKSKHSIRKMLTYLYRLSQDPKALLQYISTVSLREGVLELVQWVHRKLKEPLYITGSLVNHIIREGYYSVLEYLLRTSSLPESSTNARSIVYAIRYNQWEILDLLSRSPQIPRNENCILEAIRLNQIEYVEYCLAHNFPVTQTILTVAIRKGNVVIVHAIAEHLGVVYNENHLFLSMYYDFVRLTEYILECNKNLIITREMMIACAENGCARIVHWAYRYNYYPLNDPFPIYFAIASGQHCVLDKIQDLLIQYDSRDLQ